MNRLATLLVLPLLLASCSGSSGTSGSAGTVAAAGPATAQTAEVDGQDTLKFSPNVVTAKVGKLALTVGNKGGTPHNLVFGDASLPKTGTIGGKESQVLMLTFASPGTYTFECTFHPGMTGKVVVS